MNKADRRWRRLFAAIALSIAFHGALVGGLLLRRRQLPPPEPQAIELALVPPAPAERASPPGTAPAEPNQASTPDPLPPSPSSRRSTRAIQPRGPAAVPAVSANAPPFALTPPPAAVAAGVATPPQAPRTPPGLAEALRAADCAETGRLTARQRAGCNERLGAGGGAPLAPTQRQRDLAYDDDERRNPTRNAYNALRGDGMHCDSIAGCLPPAANGQIRFGKIPKALPVIPPSTLRGDDDALSPRPRP